MSLPFVKVSFFTIIGISLMISISLASRFLPAIGYDDYLCVWVPALFFRGFIFRMEHCMSIPSTCCRNESIFRNKSRSCNADIV